MEWTIEQLLATDTWSIIGTRRPNDGGPSVAQADLRKFVAQNPHLAFRVVEENAGIRTIVMLHDGRRILEPVGDVSPTAIQRILDELHQTLEARLQSDATFRSDVENMYATIEKRNRIQQHNGDAEEALYWTLMDGDFITAQNVLDAQFAHWLTKDYIDGQQLAAGIDICLSHLDHIITSGDW